MIKVKQNRKGSRMVSLKGSGSDLLLDFIIIGKNLLEDTKMPVEMLDIAFKAIKLEVGMITEDELMKDIEK